MTRAELAEIETIIRQRWAVADSPFASWLLADRRQVIGVLALISNRLTVHPKRLPPER